MSNLLPFPLETLQTDLAEVYSKIELISKRIEVAKRNNLSVETNKEELKKIQFTLDTCNSLLLSVSRRLDRLF